MRSIPLSEGGGSREVAVVERTVARPVATRVRPVAPASKTAPRPAGRPAPAPAAGRGGRLAHLPTAPAIAILVGVLCVFGLIMVGSASPVISLGQMCIRDRSTTATARCWPNR